MDSRANRVLEMIRPYVKSDEQIAVEKAAISYVEALMEDRAIERRAGVDR